MARLSVELAPSLGLWSLNNHREDTGRARAIQISRDRYRLVIHAISASLSCGTAPGAAYQSTFRVLCGSRIVFEQHMAIQTVAGQNAPPIQLTDLEIRANVGEDVIIEFSDDCIANVHQTVNASGYYEALPLPPRYVDTFTPTIKRSTVEQILDWLKDISDPQR